MNCWIFEGHPRLGKFYRSEVLCPAGQKEQSLGHIHRPPLTLQCEQAQGGGVDLQAQLTARKDPPGQAAVQRSGKGLCFLQKVEI